MALSLGCGRPTAGATFKTLLLGSAFSLVAGAAFAQADTEVSEVVITAMKRATTVQETPVAITAVTGETLQDIGATSITDYVKLVPSLRIQDGGTPGSRRISLRGVTAPGEPTVGVYYDETPISGSVGVSSDAGGRAPDLAIFDVERLEVLRGPQGTLYGSSSMGGAIRIIFEKPKYEYEGAIEGTAATTDGGDPTYIVNGMVNVPLIDGKLATRLVVYHREIGGYVDNTFLGIKNVNEAITTGGRLLVRFEPTDTLTIDASVSMESSDAYSSTWQPTIGEYESAAQVKLPYSDDTRIYNVTANWDLGFATLTGVSSYFDRKSEYAADDSYYIQTFLTPARCASIGNGGAPCSPERLASFYGYVNSLTPAAIHYPGTTSNWTNELRLSSAGDNFVDWTVGVFSENRDNSVNGQDARADRETGEIIRPLELFYRRYIVDEFKQVAAFGEASVHLTPTLTLTAGARYFSYDKDVTGWLDIPWDLINARVLAPSTVKSSESGWNLKFNASWEPTEDTLIYATAAEGFRPGGANQVIGLPEFLTPYEADSLWNYEVGAKTAWFDRRLFLNGALFQIDWDNMQVRGRTADNAFSFLSNAGAARIRGAELEFIAHPMSGLSVNGNINYLDAELTEDQISSTISAPGRKGDRIPDIPKTSAALAADYTWPVTDGVDGFVRGDFNYVGSSYSTLRPTDATRVKVKSYTLTNVRFGVESNAGEWGAYVYVNNVFNELAINSASRSSTPPFGSANSAPPRIMGVTLRRKF
jgi:outer membrane receptor protein involved in Fe transport